MSKTTTRKAKVKKQTQTQALAVQGKQEVARRGINFKGPQPPPSPMQQLIELARDPKIDTVKIKELISANRELMAIQAQVAFDEAFAQMQGEIPEINRDGKIVVRAREAFGNKPARQARETPFATLAHIRSVVQPILLKYGFSLRFEHRREGENMAVRGILSHRGGHREVDEFVTGRDSSGEKNEIQSWGSSRSYAQRYLTIALLNIATFDDNGESALSSRRTGRAPAQVRSPVTVVEDSAVEREANGQGVPVNAHEIERQFITVCRPVLSGSKTVYGIKTTVGEYWTDAEEIFKVAEAAMKQKRAVGIVTEQRRDGRGKGYISVTEIVE